MDVQTRMDAVWGEMQTQLCRLSPNCAHVTDPRSGHFIQLDDPPLVVAGFARLWKPPARIGA
jgi:hypothetical protein